LRLLGAGKVLRQAIAELEALGKDAPDHTLALPLLVHFRLEVPVDPARRTSDDEEFLMETQDIAERWRDEARQQVLVAGTSSPSCAPRRRSPLRSAPRGRAEPARRLKGPGRGRT
jgi:hypothetical protein